MSTPALGVAVVSYNTAALLHRCLTSVLADTSGPVLVVDNQSRDGSPDMVRREFPGVRLRAERDNRGYGAAANIAVADLDTRYVLLLNADTELTRGTVNALAAYLDAHPTVAVAGPRTVGASGAYEPSGHRFPTPLKLLVTSRWWPGPQIRQLHPAASPARGAGIGVRGLVDRLVRRNEWRPRSVDWVLGAALAIRREAFEAVGGFDEAYFLYQEEIDLSFRLRAAGWEIHYAPVATIVHVGGASTSQRAVETFAQFVRSTMRFSRLRFSRPKAAGVRAVLASVLWARLARARLELTWTQDPARLEGIRARSEAWRRGLAVLRETSPESGRAG